MVIIVMQGSQIGGRGKNKAADLKRMMQIACKTERTETIEAEPPMSLREEELVSNRSRVQKVSPANSLITQLKELNMKKGLTTVSIKNKQNQCTNKKRNPALMGSMVGMTPQISTSLKQIKIIPPLTSIDFSKITIINPASTTSKTRNPVRIPNQGLRVPPATQRSVSARGVEGLKITDFSLGRKLGKGRFGSVRLAQHKTTRFLIAIKTINIQQLKEQGMESQLIEQVKLQMFCSHPNILQMYGCFSDSKNIYLLLELGNTCLFHELRKEKHYSEEKTAYYIIQVIESLKYIHSESILHRDIKPENILVTEGVLKLSDFGWSTYSPSLKRQTFCGTLEYVSPEIVNGEYYDEKADIWSLGILCYELSVGKAPFEDRNQEATYDKILAGSISFPSGMSGQLKDLISKILLKNPQERLSMSQIENHCWLEKYKTAGRYISKEVWDLWEILKGNV